MLRPLAHRQRLVCARALLNASTYQLRRPISTKAAFVRSARAVSIGLVLGVTTFAVGLGGLYWYESKSTDAIQSIPSEWDAKTQMIVRAGVRHEDGNELSVAAELYKMAIERLISGPNFDISSKGVAWLHGYSDLLVRLGLLEDILGNEAEAKEALYAAASLPVGSKDLQIKAALQLSTYETELALKKEFITHAIQLAAGPQMEAHLKSCDEKNQPLTVPNNTSVSDNLARSLIELAKLYSSSGQYSDALSLLLSTLRGMGEDSSKDKKCIQPLIKAYLGELLWALGSRKDAVIWEEGSYYESFPKSRASQECHDCSVMAAALTSKMYGKLGMEDERLRFAEKRDSIPQF